MVAESGTMGGNYTSGVPLTGGRVVSLGWGPCTIVIPVLFSSSVSKVISPEVWLHSLPLATATSFTFFFLMFAFVGASKGDITTLVISLTLSDEKN